MQDICATPADDHLKGYWANLVTVVYFELKARKPLKKNVLMDSFHSPTSLFSSAVSLGRNSLPAWRTRQSQARFRIFNPNSYSMKIPDQCVWQLMWDSKRIRNFFFGRGLCSKVHPFIQSSVHFLSLLLLHLNEWLLLESSAAVLVWRPVYFSSNSSGLSQGHTARQTAAGNSRLRASLEFPLHLTCMFVDCGGRGCYPG